MNELNPSARILLGPGPSNIHPRVYRALSTPVVGHLDPDFLKIMDEIQEMLRMVFQTKNRFTIAVSGTGSAGMEASIVNVVEPGDQVIVGLNGVFGNRLADVVSRCGGEVIPLTADWGQPIEPHRVEDALKKHNGVKAVVLVHAETSTGILQPLEEIGVMCRNHSALFIVDTVTSLGGVPVKVDEWGIDVCYSGTQKCLSCPPGLSPMTFSDKAMHVIKSRKNKVQSWYLDMNLIESYWSESNRVYHHTAPVSMNYALREALRIILEEGLDQRFQRHLENSHYLIDHLRESGLMPAVDAAYRLPPLNAIRVPENVDEMAIRKKLLLQYGIEIGAGLGELKGKIWRIGLMGESSNKANIVYLLHALREILKH
ncbi:MAG: alanine--glyoxylate aminotransferase family protein [SAR324 cluster bacterium]|nr:alanine--glyoxylate aminotransferase family protein [SAR324 cluster bacterium]